VVTALQAIIWEGMRLAGVHDRIEGYGRLFREH
jgi:maleate cis-trans isomerase